MISMLIGYGSMTGRESLRSVSHVPPAPAKYCTNICTNVVVLFVELKLSPIPFLGGGLFFLFRTI